MKAIQITEFGGPDVMHLVDLEEPKATEGLELINVSAIGINYADTHQTENSYLSAQKLPLIPGIEVVGTTTKGVRVLAPVDGGGYAQKALTHPATMIPIPDGVTDEQALCMLVQGSTAWHILKTVGHLQPGETVVVHAAAGGVGTIAIQLAKMWGAKVIAVASSEVKRALATSLGADVVVEATHENLGDAIKVANGGKGVSDTLQLSLGGAEPLSYRQLQVEGHYYLDRPSGIFSRLNGDITGDDSEKIAIEEDVQKRKAEEEIRSGPGGKG